MKFLLPKLFLTFCVFLFAFEISHACDIVSFIAPERLCLDKAGTFRGNGIKEPGCGTNTVQNIRLVSGPGSADISFTTEEKNEASIVFSQVGSYTLEYTFEDEASCGTSICTMQAVTEVFYPTASFVEDEISICYGESIEAIVSFMDAENASVAGQGTVTVNNNMNGNMGLYRTNVPVFESIILRIIRAQDGTCTNSTVLDSLMVNVLAEPALVAIDTICDQTNNLYSGVYEISGGDGTYSLLDPSIGSISGNILTTVEMPTGASFSYNINTGPTCGELAGTASAECICNLASGTMQTERVEACADDIITVVHDKTALKKRPTDSVIYVLHNNDQADIGGEFAASYEPSFALPSAEAADTQLYISAVVGPFTLEDINLDDITCNSVSVGTPVKWFSKDEFSIAGKLEVCAGEKNRSYVVTIDEEIAKEREDLFWYTSDGSGVVIESQRSDRAFVSFPTATSSGKLFYQVDRQVADRTCSTIDSIEINVDGTTKAPEESKVLLWPGDIFASTSDGPCYQWGYIDRFANFSTVLLDSKSKYFFSDEQIGQQKLIDRAYFVAVYDTPNCEFSLNNCNSIVFYNQGILNGLSVGKEDDFSLNLSPNPSDGRMRLEINGSYKGAYRMEVLSELGHRIRIQEVQKNYLKSITDIDLSDVARGVYFLRITNELGAQQVLKTVITR